MFPFYTVTFLGRPASDAIYDTRAAAQEAADNMQSPPNVSILEGFEVEEWTEADTFYVTEDGEWFMVQTKPQYDKFVKMNSFMTTADFARTMGGFNDLKNRWFKVADGAIVFQEPN